LILYIFNITLKILTKSTQKQPKQRKSNPMSNKYLQIILDTLRNADSTFERLKNANLGDDCVVTMDFPCIVVTFKSLSLVFMADASSFPQADVRLYENYKSEDEKREYIFGLPQDEITHISMLGDSIVEKAQEFVFFCRTRVRWS